jgi:hypothetical protein
MEINWQEILVLVFGNWIFLAPIFIWHRTEARAEARNIEKLMGAIREEIKDFHGRLCAIEAKKNKGG